MDNYLEHNVIGRGQFGTVSLATRVSDLKPVVIKKIPLDVSDANERDSALNEAHLLKVLDHPNIIHYFENFIGEQNMLMIVMEYARGGTLATMLAQQAGVPIPLEVILHLFCQMALAIAYIHARNILHRDLKPQNIMLDESMRTVKLGDFGISTVLTSKTKATTVVGTPNYLGPEVCEGRPYDQKSDMWSLGCVLYEIMALRRAFEGSNLAAIVTQIQKGRLREPVPADYPEYLRKLVHWLLEKNPHFRPAAAQVLAYPPVMLAVAKVVTTVGKILSLPGEARALGPRRPKSVASDPATEQQCCFLIGEDAVAQLPTKPSSPIDKVAIGRGLAAGVVTGSGKAVVWTHEDSFDGEPELHLCHVHLDVSLVVTHVACGDQFAVALSARGLALTTGSGCYGCLGHGDLRDVAGTWRIVDGLLANRVTAVACGTRHVLAACDDSHGVQLFGWGDKSSGRLGGVADSPEQLGTTMLSRPTLVELALEPHVVIGDIFCASDASCLLIRAGQTQQTLLCSGANRANRLLLGSDCALQSHFAPALVPSFDGHIAKLSFGLKHAVLLTTAGKTWGWGENNQGQLGVNQRTVSEPTPLLSDAAADIACGDLFTVILDKDRKVKLLGESLTDSYEQWLQSVEATAMNVASVAACEDKVVIVQSLSDR